MSNPIPDFPAFDLLVGQKVAPYPGFGGVVEASSELERQLHADAARALSRVREGFGVKLDSPPTIPGELDEIIRDMWRTGWNPHTGNLNLFTREFGALLFASTLDLLGGKPVFRSPGEENVYVHTSILWPGIEAFPFHKTLKCLTRSDGETMGYFVCGVASQLEEKGQLAPEAKRRLPERRHRPEAH